MFPDNLIFLTACPKDLYFQWQLEVMITNFRRFGFTDQLEVVVWYPSGYNTAEWDYLLRKYSEVRFFFYEDRGVNLGLYIPQLRPHALRRHFEEHKQRLQGKVFFYHDSDIVFTRDPGFDRLVTGDTCHQSDTSSYLDYHYLRSKEVEGKLPEGEIVDRMAAIGGIAPAIIKNYAGKTGGAQCMLKNIDETFWEDVERMCLDIRTQFYHGVEGSVNKTYFASEALGLQSWCADMWALNFSLWKRNIETDVTPLLDFSWATDSEDTYYKKPIYHNAGVAGSSSGLFYKGDWINKSPLGKDLSLPPQGTASRKYVEAILAVK